MSNVRRIKPGDLVKFVWIANYMAPDAIVSGKSWIELFPGDRGIVIHSNDDGTSDGFVVTVLFSRVQKLISLHPSMLSVENDVHEHYVHAYGQLYSGSL